MSGRVTAIAAACVLAAGLSACGSSAKTNTVTQTVTSNPTPATSSPAPTSSCSATNCASTPEQAGAIVRRVGFTADTQTFDPRQPLNVLIGVRTGSADGTAQNAFFFWNGHYLGTDTADISAGIKVESVDGNTATLIYRLYKAPDPQCCGTAGEASVRYRFEGSRLVPLDPIPTGDFGATPSRR